jgi:hypothetical protein
MMLKIVGASAQNMWIPEQFVVVDVCGSGELRCVSSAWNLVGDMMKSLSDQNRR